MNGDNKEWDVVGLPDGRLNVLLGNKSYNVYVDYVDRQKKQIRLRVNQHLYDLEIQEPIDLLLKKMGLNLNTAKKAESINAPMPGLVLSILVEEGQSLKKGEQVLILEAMKMENVFLAERDCVIVKILAKKGDNLGRDDVILEFQ